MLRELEEESESMGRQLIMQAAGGSSDVGKERAITGTIKFTTMQQNRVIKEVDNVKYDFDILKNSQF